MKIAYIHTRKDLSVAHPVHRAWAESIKPSYITTFIPSKLYWLQELLERNRYLYKFTFIINQPLAFLKSFYIPNADVYYISTPTCIPTIFKKHAKVISLNADPFFILCKRFIVNKYCKMLLKKIDGMISVTHYMKSLAEKYLRVPHEVVYPFIDVKKFSKVEPDFNSFNICSIGGPSFIKGTDYLIKAYTKIKKLYPKSKLFILGEGPLLRYARKHAIAPGRVDPLPYLQKSRVYIQPSRHESSGTAVLEAMCSGFIPIVSENVGFKELIEKVNKEFIIKLNVDHIIKKIDEIFNNCYDLEKLGKKCKKIAIKYTKERQCNQFKEKFYRILNQLH